MLRADFPENPRKFRCSKFIHDFFRRSGYNVPHTFHFRKMGVFSLRKICNAIDRFCLYHPRFGIPHLMRYVVFITAAVYFLDMFSQSYASYMLFFNANLILQGELWRLVTWLFIPDGTSVLWVLISFSFYYFIGEAIESYWGPAKFTLFYFTGALLMVALAFLSLLWSPFPIVSSGYLNRVLFLAFATLYPTALVRVYLILPIQAKWLALLYVVLTVYDLVRGGLTMLVYFLLPLLGVWIAYALFFWDRIADLLAEFGVAVRHQNSSQTIHFKSAVRQQKKKEAAQGYRHKCEVCGRTDADFPDLQFRYCSKCAGYHCFCEDHIFSHTHFTQ